MSSRTEEVRSQGESDALVAVSQKRRSLIPAVYRRLLSDAQPVAFCLGWVSGKGLCPPYPQSSRFRLFLFSYGSCAPLK